MYLLFFFLCYAYIQGNSDSEIYDMPLTIEMAEYMVCWLKIIIVIID